MNVSVRATMKGAAKCDKHCELQNSVNRQELERILRFRDIPESMPASVSTFFTRTSLPPWCVDRANACRASGLRALLQRGFALARPRRLIAELRCDRQLLEPRGHSDSCAASSVSSAGSLPTRCCDPDTLGTSAIDRDMKLGRQTR